MALLTASGKIIGGVRQWYRGAKAKYSGTNYGPSWIHWEAPKIRNNDRQLITPVDDNNKELDTKRKHDLIRGKF